MKVNFTGRLSSNILVSPDELAQLSLTNWLAKHERPARLPTELLEMAMMYAMEVLASFP